MLSCFCSLNTSIFKILKKIPYSDITVTKIIPKNIFVLKIAKASRLLDNFIAKICVTIKVIITKAPKISNENNPAADDNMKNHTDNPNVTAKDLNLGEESSNLDRINQTYETCLC